MCNTDLLPTNLKTIETKLGRFKRASINVHKTCLYENNFKLNFTIVDCPGFGDSIDNSFSWVPMSNFIDDQLRLYMFREEQPDRSQLIDSRVHACLYFISPTNNGLTPLDIKTMKELSKRVNLIPVISKADGYTKAEMINRKDKVKRLIKFYGIEICQYLRDASLYSSIIEDMPYSLIGAEGIFENGKGEKVRGRQYPWGVSELENSDQCDFVKLRDLLMGENMLDLIQSTENHYENYRCELLRFRLYQENLKAEGLGFSKPESLIRVDQNGTLSKKFTEVDYYPKIDGLAAFSRVSKVPYSIVQQYVLESNPIYLHKQFVMKKKFSEIVTLQEKKFRDWKKALFDKQSGFNKDIEQLHNKMVKYQETIDYLNGISSGTTAASSYEDESTAFEDQTANETTGTGSSKDEYYTQEATGEYSEESSGYPDVKSSTPPREPAESKHKKHGFSLRASGVSKAKLAELGSASNPLSALRSASYEKKAKKRSHTDNNTNNNSSTSGR